MTVGNNLECVPDKCSWLAKLAHGKDEKLADLCHRLGYPGRVNHLSAVTCLLDDTRILELLPADGDLVSQMRMRLPELLVARDAYQAIHGFSPCPYKLLSLTFERRGSGSLSREALHEASEHRATVLTGKPDVCGADVGLHCYPHDDVIARISVLGMSAAAKVMLTSAESFQLLAQASTLVSLTKGHDWTSDTAAQVAFLILSAYHEWIERDPEMCSPTTAVPISKWENVLALMTGVSVAKIRICKVRVINAMKVDKPKEWRAVGSPSCDAVEAAVLSPSCDAVEAGHVRRPALRSGLSEGRSCLNLGEASV